MQEVEVQEACRQVRVAVRVVVRRWQVSAGRVKCRWWRVNVVVRSEGAGSAGVKVCAMAGYRR